MNDSDFLSNPLVTWLSPKHISFWTDCFSPLVEGVEADVVVDESMVMSSSFG